MLVLINNISPSYSDCINALNVIKDLSAVGVRVNSIYL